MFTRLMLFIALASPAVAKPYAYVAITNNNLSGNIVQVIDLKTNSVVGNITVGVGPQSMAETPDGTKLYVAALGAIYVIDTGTNMVAATVPVGGDPSCVAVSPNGQYVYAGNDSPQSVSVIQVSTNTLVATIPVDSPEQIVLSPDSTRVFVTDLSLTGNPGGGGVTVIDAMANQVVTSIPLPDGVDALAIAPNDTAIYVGEINLNEVAKISTVSYKIVAQIPVGARPIAIAITPNGRAAYVADSALFGGTPDVEEVKLSTNQVIASITVGTDPVALAFSANGNFLYAVNQLSNSVSVIDTLDNTVTATIPVSVGPDAIAMQPIKDTLCQ